MRFLFLLYGDEAAELAMTDAERREIVDRHIEFSADLRAKDQLRGSDPLGRSRDAAVVRPNGSVSDGPFAETKEQLGGYYVVECADRAEALELAKRVPESPGSIVEVWPLVDI